MADVKKAYKSTTNIYDDILTQNKWWSRLYIKIFWGGIDDREIAKALLDYIPNDFRGSLLDVPIGTAIFTKEKYEELHLARIYGVDYSDDMLEQAKYRLEGIKNVKLIQGDVHNLDFDDESFDIVLCMNGLHVFPDKDKAYSEIYRVLKPGGLFIACLYVSEEYKLTDFVVNNILCKKGWFTGPFDNKNELEDRLNDVYSESEIVFDKAMAYFRCVK